MNRNAKEIAGRDEDRGFEFGENWLCFLRTLNDDRIQQARRSLQEMLGVETLAGKTFLDVGSGSGLFSLVARQLGATVHAFDHDPQSVACTNRLKATFFPDDDQWRVEEASVLDRDYLQRLGQFDIVYSWGVLHHTGNLWTALANIIPSIAPDGRLFIAVYNDQGRASRFWLKVKRWYNTMPRMLRPLLILLGAIRLWGPTMVRDIIHLRPFYTWRTYGEQRGMSPWRDVFDWVGGYPFEVAKPEQVFDFCRNSGLELRKLKTCGGGHGCNEYVFKK